jgi:hypothetical protein
MTLDMRRKRMQLRPSFRSRAHHDPKARSVLPSVARREAADEVDDVGVILRDVAGRWQRAPYSDGYVPTTGGTPTTLATNQENAYPLALDSSSLYWAVDPCKYDDCPGRLMRRTPK